MTPGRDGTEPFFIKNRRKCPFYGQQLRFLVSAKQSKTPEPYLEGAGCKNASGMETEVTKPKRTASNCTNTCHVSSKIGQNGHFMVRKMRLLTSDKQCKAPPTYLEGAVSKFASCMDVRVIRNNVQHLCGPKWCHLSSKIGHKLAFDGPDFIVLASHKELQEHLPVSSVLDEKPQVVRTYRSRQDNVQQNVPFFIKHWPKLAILWSKMQFSGLGQAVQDAPPPPLFCALLMRKRILHGHTDHKNTIYTICWHQNVPFFINAPKLPTRHIPLASPIMMA